MSQLRFLQPATLYKATKVKQSNGATIETYTTIKTHYVTVQELTDEISATIYGAKLNSMYRISSIRNELESYLQEKTMPTIDNSSDYIIVMTNRKYRIASVKSIWVDIELLGTYETISA